MNPFLKGVLTNKVATFLISKPLETLDESLEEGAQQIITDLSVTNAMKDAGITVDQKEEFKNALKDGFMAFKQSLIPMGVIGIPGIVKGGVKLARQQKGGENAEGNGISTQEGGQKKGPSGGESERLRIRDNAQAGMETQAGKVSGPTRQLSQEVAQMPDAEVKQLLLRAKIPEADISKLTLDEQAEIADREIYRQKQAEKTSNKEPSPYQAEQPTDESRATGEAVAKKYGLQFKEAVPGDRDKGGVQLVFSDPITQKDITVSAGTADVDAAKIADNIRQENPVEYGRKIAESAGVEFLGRRERIAEAKGAGKYNTEMRAEYKTPNGNTFTLPFTSTANEIRIRAEEMDKQGAPNVPEKVQGRQEEVTQEPVAPAMRPTQDTDRMLRMYVKTGKTETTLGKAAHDKLVQVFDQVAPEDVAEAAGITPVEAREAIGDIRALQKTPVAEKVRQTLAPSLFYGESVDEAVKSIKQPRATGDEVMFSREEYVGKLPVLKGENGNELVDYEWRWKWGTKFSNREGGDVDARVSDWEDKDVSTGTGRNIVHVYYIKNGKTGVVEPHGIESAKKMLGRDSTRIKKIADKIAAKKAYEKNQFKLETEGVLKRADRGVDINTANAEFYKAGHKTPANTSLYEKNGKYIRVQSFGWHPKIVEENGFIFVSAIDNDKNVIKENPFKNTEAKPEPAQQEAFGGETPVSEIERKAEQRQQKSAVTERQEASKGGEAPLAGLPMFENQDIEGSQQTLNLQREERPMDLDTAKEMATSNGLQYVTSTPAAGGPSYTFRDPRTGTEFTVKTRGEVRQAMVSLVDRVAPKGTTKAGTGIRFQREARTPEQEATLTRLKERQRQEIEGIERDKDEEDLTVVELAQKRIKEFIGQQAEKGLYLDVEGEWKYADPKTNPGIAEENWTRWERDIAESIGAAELPETPFAKSREAPRAEVRLQREDEIIYDSGTDADKAHGQAIADQLGNVKFNGVWKGFRSKDGTLYNAPQLTFTIHGSEKDPGDKSTILTPLNATAGQVAKRRIEALKGVVKYQIEEQKEGQREPTSLRREEPTALHETPGRNIPAKDREAGNAVPENVSAVVAFSGAVERDLGQKLPEGSIEAVDTPQEEVYQVTDRLISEEFGRTPVWFKVSREAEDAGVRIGGALMMNRPNDIFINTNTNKPVIVTAVHETMHVMQEEHPDIYKDLATIMVEEGTLDFDRYIKKMIDKGYSKEEVMYEVVAEISGERFTDTEFLNALHERSPDAFRAFVETLRRVIQQIKDWIRKSGIEHAGKYFVDLNRVDRVLQDSLIEMRRRGKPEMRMAAQREARFSKEEKEPAYKINDKRAAHVTVDQLPAIYEEARTFDGKTAAERLKKRFGIKKQSMALARYLGRTVSGTLLEISPVIRDALQKQVNRVMIDTAKANRRVLPLVKAISKMPEEDAKVFDIAAKNADSDKINELADKYNFRKELDEYRKVMDEIVQRAKDAGYETGYLKDYFPRIPKDRDAYRNYIRGLPEWGQIEEAMRQKSKEVGHDLNEDEQAEFLNLYIRGYGNKMGGPGQLKERTVKYLDNEMNALLEDTRLAIPLYVEGMIKKIARKEFFGNKKETDELYINDIDQSIGDYVAEQIRKKNLDPLKQDQLVGLFKSYFNYKPTNRTIAMFKNLGYATSMGSGFSSMFSQMQDAAFGFYTAPGSEIGAVIRSILGKTEITIKDLGIDDIAAEFRDPGKLAKFVDHLLRGVGLKYGDSIFKNAFLDANLRKYRAMAKSGKINKDFRHDLDNIFGDEAESVIADLKAGVDSNNVKLLMLNQISKFQPTTLLQVPQAYLDSPRGRIAYALKTYQINQFNAIVDESIRAMDGAKDVKAFGRAFGRIAGITAILLAAGVGTDRLKDFLFRRQATWGQYTVDNILKLIFISRYITWQAREQGIYASLIKLVAPPMSWMDYVGKDIIKGFTKPEDFKLKDMESIRILPVVGQEFYWWTGGGYEKTLKQAIKRSEPKKFEREINKLKSDAREAYKRGDAEKAKELQKKATDYLNENVPKVREYYNKELSKKIPRNYNFIIESMKSTDQKKRYKATKMIEKLTPGQKALLAKYKLELEKESK